MTEQKEDSISDMTTEKKNTTAGYERIRQLFVRKNIMKGIAVLLIIYTVILIIRICNVALMNAAIPNEYREAANIQLTLEFLKGNNPYSINAYGKEQPGLINVYGPLYSLVTAFLGHLIHVDIIVLHYIVTFIAVIVSAALAAFITYEKTEYPVAPAAVFLFIINCSWRYGYINAVPDSFALMLMMIIFFIMSRKDFRLKNPLCALLSIALFFVKQYFVIIVVTIFIYKLINDRKDAIRFFLYTTVFTVLVFFLVSITCPLYWTYTVFLAHGPVGGTYDAYMSKVNSREIEEKKTKKKIKETEADVEKEEGELTNTSENTDPAGGFGYEILQLRSLGGMFLFVFLAALIGVILEIKGGFKSRAGTEAFLIISMAVSFAALIYLGRNSGAWLSYYLQLLMPETIIYAFIVTDRQISRTDGILSKACLVFLIIMVFFTAYRTNGRLKTYAKTEEEMDAWDRAYALTETAAEKGEVYYVPPLGFQTFYNGQYLYNNGHNMAANGLFLNEYNTYDWERRLFPHAGVVLKEHYDYQMKIKEKVKNKEYEMVTIIPGMDTDFERLDSTDLENAGYQLSDKILLDTGRLSYEAQFWTR